MDRELYLLLPKSPEVSYLTLVVPASVDNELGVHCHETQHKTLISRIDGEYTCSLSGHPPCCKCRHV